MSDKNSIWLTVLLFCLFPFGLLAQDWLEQPVSYQAENDSRSTILFDLSDAYKFDLGFDGNLPGLKDEIDIEVKDVPLRSVLRQVLAGTELTFIAKSKRIVIRLKPPVYYTFSGFMEDAASNERLVAGSVYNPATGRGAITNGYGFFSLQLPAGPQSVRFSYLGYQLVTEDINMQGSVARTIRLTADANLPEIVVTSGTASRQDRLTTVGRQFTGDALSKQRSLGGEASLFDLVYQETDSQRGADGLGGLFVRGGGADQNLVLLDDVPIFQPSHGFGLFSVINPAIMRSARFYQDGFPARFGGRLASVLDVRSKEGNTQQASTEIEFSTIATKIKFEQPLAGNTGALLFAARRTHLDPIFKIVSTARKDNNNALGSSNYHFFDLNLKWHQQLGTKDRLFASFYHGRDAYRNDDYAEYDLQNEQGNLVGEYIEDVAQELKWGNSSASLRWNHLFNNDQTFANTTLTYGRYGYQSYNTLFTDETIGIDTIASASYASFSSVVNDLRLKVDVDHYQGNHHWQFGLAGLVRGFIPGAVFDESTRDSLTPDVVFQEVFEDQQFPSFSATEFAVYASDDYRFDDKWALSIGLRVALFNNSGSTFLAPEPRLSLAWHPTSRWDTRLSLERMRQPIHLLTTSGASLPTDLWVPANEAFGPQDSWQVSLANSLRPGDGWTVKFQTYFRQMRQLLQYAQDIDFPGLEETPTEFWESSVVQGKGRSFGASTTVSYQRPRTEISGSYFFQRSSREFAELNDGESFPFSFDRPHKLTFSFTSHLPRHWRLNLHWEYSSGRPITLIQSETVFDPLDNFPTVDFTLLTGTNAFRLPAYHRLDLSVSRNWEKKGRRHQLQLGVYNAYNRANTYFAYELLDTFGDGTTERLGVRSLPVLPSLSYGLSF